MHGGARTRRSTRAGRMTRPGSPRRARGTDARSPSTNGSELGAAVGHFLAVGAAAALTTMSRGEPARAVAILVFLVGWALVSRAESRVEVSERPVAPEPSKEIPRWPNDRYH